MKKVLIISYYWPPSSGSGVQRWLKFAKYLPNNNWQPIIYTPENPYVEIEDKSLLSNISLNTQVWSIPIWEPYTLKDRILGKESKTQSSGLITKKGSFKNKILNWVRGNMFIPDPKVYWVKPSVEYLLKRLKEDNIQHVITTGPPHSMHLIGLHLKKKLPNIRWIADFRDPWSELDLLDEFYLSNLARRKHQRLEKEVLKIADITLTVSETWTRDFKRLGAKRVELITNGYDADDFDVLPRKNDKFIIGHYGLLNHLRNPSNLWNALDSLCDKHSEFNMKLEIHLSGNIDQDIIHEIKSFPYLKDKVRQFGYLSHQKVMDEYNQASILLLLLFNSKSGIGNYPGKIFEYFAARKPILAFGPVDSDVQKLLAETNTGTYFSYKEKNLKENILQLFLNSDVQNSKDTDINCYTREKLTQDLVNLLNTL